MNQSSAMTWIEGQIAVEAAILAERREVAILLVDENRRDGRIARLQSAARERGIVVQRVPSSEIARHAQSDHHGGVLAQVGPRRMQEYAELLQGSLAPAVFMLDGVEDPHNFGQALRTIYAAGATGLLVRPRNWLSADNVVGRASAGASEYLPATAVGSADEAAALARDAGLLVACAAVDDATPVDSTDLTQPFLVVIGGEKRGVKRSFARAADVRLAIPYGRQDVAYDLGTAAAATIIAYEMMRQRLAAASHTGA